MAKAWPTPPPTPQDLPICFYPGCHERAPYGYGVTLKSFGTHFCGKHRPDRPGAPRLECAAEPEPARVGGDLFDRRRAARGQ